MKKTLKNYFYYTLLIILNSSFSLLTAPIVSRTLGPEKLGLVNYAYSILLILTIIGSFGIPIYGIRKIATIRDKGQENINIFNTRIFIFNLIYNSIITLIYLLLCLNTKDFILRSLLLMMSITVFMNMFNYEWFFIGIEEVKTISIRNLIVKILSLILIVIFVRNSSHYYIYGLILSLSLGINYLLSFILSLKKWSFNFSKFNLGSIIKEAKFFYFTALITSAFSMFDRVIVGFYDSYQNLAYFVRNRQIVTMIVLLITSITKVLSPKLSNLIAKKDIFGYKNVLDKSLMFLFILIIPSMIGVFILSNDIELFFGTKEFLNGATSLRVLSILLILSSLNVFLDNHISIPNNKEIITTYVVLMISVISILLMLVTINDYSILGVSYALVFAEFFGLILHIILLKKNSIQLPKLLDINHLKVLLATLVMVFFLTILNQNTIAANFYINFIIKLFISATIYLLTLFILRHKFLYDEFKKLFGGKNEKN